MGSKSRSAPPATTTAAATRTCWSERSTGEPAFTAVFDKIAEGEYTLWVDDVAHARDVAIAGGKIAELDWTTSSAQARQAGSPASG